jgi:hypothetical protein
MFILQQRWIVPGIAGNFCEYRFFGDIFKLFVAETVSGCVAGDLVHPWHKFAGFLVTARISQHTDESFLHQVFARWRRISELAEKVV